MKYAIGFNEYPTGVTPKGVLHYPHLLTPSTKFDDAGKYECSLVLGGEEAQELIATIEKIHAWGYLKILVFEQEAAKAAGKKVKKKLKVAEHTKPYHPLLDDDDEEIDGEFVFTFKKTATGTYKVGSKKAGQKWTASVGVEDSAGHPVTQEPWSGTVGKVKYTAKPWYTSGLGYGLKLELEKVRVLELVTGAERDDGEGFGDAEEGYRAPAQEDAPSAATDVGEEEGQGAGADF